MQAFHAILAGIGLSTTIYSIYTGEQWWLCLAYGAATAWFTYRAYSGVKHL